MVWMVKVTLGVYKFQTCDKFLWIVDWTRVVSNQQPAQVWFNIENNHFDFSAICPAGSYSLSGHAPCQLCPLNEFQSATESTSCTACDPGYKTTSKGSTASSDCIYGDYLFKSQMAMKNTFANIELWVMVINIDFTQTDINFASVIVLSVFRKKWSQSLALLLYYTKSGHVAFAYLENKIGSKNIFWPNSWLVISHYMHFFMGKTLIPISVMAQ